MTTLQRKIALVKSLRDDYDHAFLSEAGVKNFTEPFGFTGRTYKARDTSRSDPKGLNLGGLKEAVGQDADQVALQIADHLGVTPAPKLGRGSRLRAACDAILAHLEKQ